MKTPFHCQQGASAPCTASQSGKCGLFTADNYKVNVVISYRTIGKELKPLVKTLGGQ